MTVLISKETQDKLIDEMDWKDIRFCHEYLLDQDPFEAAKRAGFRQEEADAEGNRLMNTADAIMLITSLAGERGVKLKMDQEDDLDEEIEVDKNFIISRLARIADYNSQAIRMEMMTKSGDIITNEKMRDPSAAIKALELLGKTKAMFIDKKEVEVGKDMAQLIREARIRAGIMQADPQEMERIIEGEKINDE